MSGNQKATIVPQHQADAVIKGEKDIAVTAALSEEVISCSESPCSLNNHFPYDGIKAICNTILKGGL